MEEANDLKKMVPLQEGLFTPPEPDPGASHLLGSRCRECGSIFFPTRIYCGRCCTTTVETLALSRRGKLFSYSLNQRKGKLALVDVPYVEAEVELPEGVHVFTVLTVRSPEGLHLGMDMELVIEKVAEDNAGNDVVAYKFRPAS